MINKHANILFIQTSIGGYSAEPQQAASQNGYYQQLIHASLARSIYTIEGFQVLGRQLAAIARHAYFAKQMNAVEQATQLMLGLPLSKQLEGVARYYQALCIWRQGDRDGARQSLERVAEAAIPQYRARALNIIGLTYTNKIPKWTGSATLSDSVITDLSPLAAREGTLRGEDRLPRKS